MHQRHQDKTLTKKEDQTPQSAEAVRIFPLSPAQVRAVFCQPT